MLEHSLKFTLLSKYACSLVLDLRDEINHFLTGVSDCFMEESRSVIIHENMGISSLMLHSQHV